MRKYIHGILTGVVIALILFLNTPEWVKIATQVVLVVLAGLTAVLIANVLQKRRRTKEVAKQLYSVATNETGLRQMSDKLVEYAMSIYTAVVALDNENPKNNVDIQRKLAQYEHLVEIRRSQYKILDKKREQFVQDSENSVIKLASGDITAEQFIDSQKKIKNVSKFR